VEPRDLVERLALFERQRDRKSRPPPPGLLAGRDASMLWRAPMPINVAERLI
jgi:hypothetical protein